MKDIVLKELKKWPSNMRMGVLKKGTFSRDELIKEVENDTEIGILVREIIMCEIKQRRFSE